MKLLALALTATVALFALDDATAKRSDLRRIPNGNLFNMSLGHKTGGGYTDFAIAFYAASRNWTIFCPTLYPGTSLTNGEAFGDPCCMWNATTNPIPDFNITNWTTLPTVKTVCGGTLPPTSLPVTVTPTPTTSTPPPSTATPAPTTKTPAPTTKTPAPTTKKPTKTPAPTTKKPVKTPAPTTQKPVKTPVPPTKKPMPTKAPAPTTKPTPNCQSQKQMSGCTTPSTPAPTTKRPRKQNLRNDFPHEN